MLARGDEHALIHRQDLCASPQGAQLWCQHWIGEFSSLHTLGPLRSLRRQARRNSKSYAAQGLLCYRHRVGATVPTLHREGAFGHQRGGMKASPRGTSDPLALAWHGQPRPTLQLLIFEASPQRKATYQIEGEGTALQRGDLRSWWWVRPHHFFR